MHYPGLSCVQASLRGAATAAVPVEEGSKDECSDLIKTQYCFGATCRPVVSNRLRPSTIARFLTVSLMLENVS